ncbi:MAG: hypothetical protein IT429_25575 [Gemmataceae bacterium]|nr:hypothetical protein [Gemmataceae bacterium]
MCDDGGLVVVPRRCCALEITPPTADGLTTYLAPFLRLVGDRRTAALPGATVRGIVASESLVCARIAAFSPSACRRAA